MTGPIELDAAPHPSPTFRVWGPQAAMLSAVVAVGVLPLLLTGAMSVQIQASMGLGEGALGGAFAVFFGSASVSSVSLGGVSERFGPTRSLQTGAVTAVVALLGIAALARTWLSLAAFLMVAGLGSALTRPATNLYISRLVPHRRQGLAFGIKQSSVPIASLLAGLLVPTVALTAGWRWGFVVGALLAVLALAGIPRGSAARERTAGPPDRAADLPVRLLALLAGSVAFATAGASSLGAFSVPTIVEAGFGEGTSGLLFAAGSVVGLSSRVAVGWLADRRGGGHLRFVAGMLVAGAVGFLLLAMGGIGPVLIAVPLTFATAWGFLGLFNLAVVRMNPGAPAAATGITQTGTFFGGVAGPWGLGVLAERHSFAVAWAVAATLTLAAAGMILAVRRLVRGRGTSSYSSGRS